MRSSFILKLVNGPLYDPIAYIRLINGSQAVMFDCGRFFTLSNSEMLLLDALFISHMHMDHFMGFDTLLRVILHRDKPLEVYGPEGIIEKVNAKLSSYTWNLTQEYKFAVNVSEVREGSIKRASFPASAGFLKSSEDTILKDGYEIYSCSRFKVDAVILDHNIPCLAFALEEKFKVNIRAEALKKCGYLPGPWLTRLKEALVEGVNTQIIISTEEGEKTAESSELGRDIAIVSKGQKIAYIADVRYSDDNVEKFAKISMDTDILLIETFYLNELEEEAFTKGHLTAGQASKIAKHISASKVIPMHISPRHHKMTQEIYSQCGVSLEG